MSSKHLRRLLEEQQGKNEGKDEVDNVSGNETEEEEPPRQAPRNRFALMGDDESSNNGSENEEEHPVEEAKKSPPKKELPSSETRRNKKKKNKKNKKKTKETSADEDDEDTLLEKLAQQNEESTDLYGESAAFETAEIEQLFKVDPRLFDPAAELKKALGKAFKENTNTSNHHRQVKAAGRIVKQKFNWPPPKSIGLSMSLDKEEGDIKWYKYEHGSHYETLERMGWVGEDAMDISVAEEILNENYYHLNSLLILANMFRMQEDVTHASDLIERGIFYCEQYFHSQFHATSWKHRLDYRHYENRAIYLFLHRFMLNCVDKRCFETALNVAKLIFTLDPQGDPLAVLLSIDSIAIKARHYRWIKTLYTSSKAKIWKRLDLLPNFLYSIALVNFLDANTDAEKEEADKALTTAICRFPGVVTQLLDELQVQADAQVESNKYLSIFAYNNETDGLKLVVKMFVKQTAELWKDPDTLSWLESITRQVIENPENEAIMKQWQTKRAETFIGLPPNIKRLAVLMGLSSSDHAVTDPEPPANGFSRYKRTKNNNILADQGVLASFLHSMFPDYNPEQTIGASLRQAMDFFGLGGLAINPDNQAEDNNGEQRPQGENQ